MHLEELFNQEPEEFAAMQLDENELEEALREGRKKKYFQIKNKEYWDKLSVEEETAKLLTAEELGKALVKTPVGFDSNGKEIYFKIDDDNREVVKMMCYYFTNDKRFEDAGYSLSKGLLLQGGVGVGKSKIMTLLQQNQKQSFRVISCIDVANMWINQTKQDQENGNVLARLFANTHSALGANPYGHRQIGYCFDDLGTEELRALNFGTAKNTMEEVLWKRHANGLFTTTHITTNLSAEELKESYGHRIYDRMREMFNQITWPKSAKSRR